MEKSSSRSSFKLETPLGPSQGMEAATAAEEPVAKAPENATSGVIQNIPGSVHETPPPVVNLPLPAAPHPAPTAQTEVPVYSPRSSFIPPDIEVAKRHASENRPMMRDASGQIIPYPLGAHISEITDLGMGTQMYLELVKRFIAYFLLASVICVPSLAIILLSASKQIGGIQNSPLEPLKVFSIASLFSGNFSATDELSPATVGCTHQECRLCSPSTCYKLHPSTVAVVISNLDLLYCIFFFLLSLFLSRWIDARDKEVNDATLTPSDFSLQVSNLANDTTVDEIKELFNNNYKLPDGSGSCALVRIAYDESKYLSAFIKQNQLKEAFENAQAAYNRSDSKKNLNSMTKCREAISKNAEIMNIEAAKRGNKNGARIVCAFVTLQLQSHVDQALVDYRDRWFYWCRLPSKYKIRGAAPRVKRAPEPDEVLWENLGLSPRSRFLRQSVSSLCALLLIIICFVVMVAAKLYSDAQTADQNKCRTLNCGLPLSSYELSSIASVFKNLSAYNMSSGCDSCICSDLQLKNPDVWIKTIDFPTFNLKATDGSPNGLCTQPAFKTLVFYALAIATVAVSAIANVGGSSLLVVLAKHVERHSSRTRYLASVVSKTAVFLVLNIAIIPLIVYARIDDIRTPLERVLPFQFPVFAGPFPDFNEKWYGVVGVSFLVTLATNAVSKTAQILGLAFTTCNRSCCAKNQDTQRQLNRLFEGPSFIIESSVGYLVSLFFMAFIFSSGLPVLIPAAFLFMIMLYWTDKIMLLRLYKKPPAITSSLLKPVVSFIPFACLMHSAFAVWCYSAKTSSNVPMLPLPSLGPAVDAYVQAFNNITSSNPEAAGVLVRYNIVERILNWVTFPSFVFCVIMFLKIFVFPWLWILLRYQPAFIVAFGIVKGVLYSIFTILKAALCCFCKNKVAPLEAEAKAQDEITYVHAVDTGLLRGVKDYELSSNPFYSTAT